MTRQIHVPGITPHFRRTACEGFPPGRLSRNAQELVAQRLGLEKGHEEVQPHVALKDTMSPEPTAAFAKPSLAATNRPLIGRAQ